MDQDFKGRLIMGILITVILVGILIYGLTDKRDKKREKLDSALPEKEAQ